MYIIHHIINFCQLKSHKLPDGKSIDLEAAEIFYAKRVNKTDKHLQINELKRTEKKFNAKMFLLY